MPVRIDCTRLILKSLKELTNTSNPSCLLSLTGEIPRLALSMSVTRCVNFLIDLQNNSKYARSVSITARAIKLPEYLVDLRHDATHGSLPDLFLLAKGIQELLNWLYEEY